tara:strand:+ start:2042 stop:2191 length:150 start_codon:yes stop_codon:yes gene_type:complete
MIPFLSILYDVSISGSGMLSRQELYIELQVFLEIDKLLKKINNRRKYFL